MSDSLKIVERKVKGIHYLYFRGMKQDLILANIDTHTFNWENIWKVAGIISEEDKRRLVLMLKVTKYMSDEDMIKDYLLLVLGNLEAERSLFNEFLRSKNLNEEKLREHQKKRIGENSRKTLEFLKANAQDEDSFEDLIKTKKRASRA